MTDTQRRLPAFHYYLLSICIVFHPWLGMIATWIGIDIINRIHVDRHQSDTCELKVPLLRVDTLLWPTMMTQSCQLCHSIVPMSAGSPEPTFVILVSGVRRLKFLIGVLTWYRGRPSGVIRIVFKGSSWFKVSSMGSDLGLTRDLTRPGRLYHRLKLRIKHDAQP